MLTLDNITRTFGELRALDSVSFDVAPGRLTGFVGGNGAGKTTTMRIVLGVLAADSGTVLLDGKPLGPVARRTIGYMPEERGLYPKMKVVDQLVHLARLHGYDRAAARRNASELVESLGLAARADEPLEKLSLGNQQRVQIAAALVHDPEVLILDEPFSGLDPIAVDTVVRTLADKAASGVPVLFSSHQLDVVERLCDDVVIIAGGRIQAAGTREGLRDEFGGTRYEIATGGDIGWLRGVPGVEVEDFTGGDAVFSATTDVAQRVLADAISRSSVTQFGMLRPTLAEIFREIVAGRDTSGDAEGAADAASTAEPATDRPTTPAQEQELAR